MAYKEQIDQIRKEWGTRLLILGHHYQRAAVLRHADILGDSLELSRKAAEHPEAARLVFCGVRFMAESADILTNDNQTVYMPDTQAGCPMANMANEPAMQEAWNRLMHVGGRWIPVVYVNSSAEIKAVCGHLGGSTCTSGNAGRVLAWALKNEGRVLFLPDEHLGRNTAHDLGIPDNQVRVYDPAQDSGGLTDSDIRAARIVVWKGYCIVHRNFTVNQVAAVRASLPTARIIIHPEAPREVVQMCDAHGSTAQIIHYAEQAPANATVVVGTELNLVQRLADIHKGRITVKALNPSVCANMARTNEENLLDLLARWPEENVIRVPAAIAKDARLALQRMLSL